MPGPPSRYQEIPGTACQLRVTLSPWRLALTPLGSAAAGVAGGGAASGAGSTTVSVGVVLGAMAVYRSRVAPVAVVGWAPAIVVVGSEVGWPGGGAIGCPPAALLLGALCVVTPAMALNDAPPPGKNAFTRYRSAVAAGAVASVYAVAIILSG